MWNSCQSSVPGILDIFNFKKSLIFNVIKQKKRGTFWLDKSYVATFWKTNSGAALKRNFCLLQSGQWIKRNRGKALCCLHKSSCLQKLNFQNQNKEKGVSRFEGHVGRISCVFLPDKLENTKFTNTNTQVREALISLSILLDHVLSVRLKV